MKNATPDTVKIAIIWKNCQVVGHLDVSNGNIKSLSTANYGGSTNGSEFYINSEMPARLTVELDDIHVQTGAYATRITVHANEGSFTFFLRDVLQNGQLFIPVYSVAVVAANDLRTYEKIVKETSLKKLVSDWDYTEQQPEESYESACSHNRKQICPTWLGLSRDMRIFRMEHFVEYGYWGWVQPMYHSYPQIINGTKDKPLRIHFVVGLGESCRVDIERHLEDGVLPILHSTQKEKGVTYTLTAFVSLENQPISLKNLRGSDWQAVYPNAGGNMLTAEDKEKLANCILHETKQREEETVCCIRIVAKNEKLTPEYAWFRAPQIWGNIDYPAIPTPPEGDCFYNGMSKLKDDYTYAVTLIDGIAMPQREMAVLLRPGQSVACEMIIPHSPLTTERAEKLLNLNVKEHFIATRKFWNDKLDTAAQINVPEQAINERIKACLLQCDINTLGLEPDGPTLATIGWYGPIGSESAPIIQFFDSMGWHDLAERSIEFFIRRQHENGFIQNYCGYQLETGPLLWTMGEHFRYTQDVKWATRVTPNILKACEYLIDWRNRNKKEELRGKGYGLQDGKVADPDDFYRFFMLNGLSYIGIARSAEMLADIAPEESLRLKREAEEFRQDIRTAFADSIANSPVIPLGDGSWIPSAAPWPEYPGPLALYAEGGDWWTHGAFGSRDSMVGALYLLISEVISPTESAGEILLKYHQKLFTVENAALTQPYYCRHDYGHLKRDEVKLFLKAYYNQLTALQDRETYTFWEHYHHASENKTHETGWFLMQTRWMLFMEEGNALYLLRAIPRKWMENGKSISIENAATYFGKLSIKVESQIEKGFIKAEIRCNNTSGLNEIKIRLPHPQGLHAKSCVGGKYDSCKETVTLSPFTGKAVVMLNFDADRQ